MADGELAALQAEVQRLQQLVRALTDRLDALERGRSPRDENASDQAAIRQKVTYDWQS